MSVSFTIGRSCSIVLIVLGSRIDLPDVIGFESRPETVKQHGWAVNGDPWEAVTIAGWRGQFDATRSSDALDELFAEIERAQRYSGLVLGAPAQPSTGQAATDARIYQYVTNPDGSTSTYEYAGCSLELIDAGFYSADGIVRQRVAFFASYRESL